MSIDVRCLLNKQTSPSLAIPEVLFRDHMLALFLVFRVILLFLVVARLVCTHSHCVQTFLWLQLLLSIL